MYKNLVQGFVLLALIIVPASSHAMTRTLLNTDSFGATEPAVASRASQSSGGTMKEDGKGGACVWVGSGNYRIEDDGALYAKVDTLCGGVLQASQDWEICSLSPDMKCPTTPLFSHQYQVSANGVAVDNKLYPWKEGAEQATKILAALSANITTRQNLMNATSTKTDTGGKFVYCTGPAVKLKVKHLSEMALFAKRKNDAPGPDLSALCRDEFLAQANAGDGIDQNSAIGKCFVAAGMSDVFTKASCVITDH